MRRHPLLPADPEFGPGVFGLTHRPETALVHLIPVPFEATVSYGDGTANGPAAILEASAQVDLLDGDTGRPHRLGIFQHPEHPKIRKWSAEARRAAEPIIEVLGDVNGSRRLLKLQDRVNSIGDALNVWLEGEVDRLLDDGHIVGIVGGDHSVPFGTIRAHAQRWPGLGILHFDAHYDLRNAYEGFSWSHASIMHNVLTRIPEVGRIVPVGIRDYCDEESTFVRRSAGRIVPFQDENLRERQLAGEPFAVVAREIAEALPEVVYVSFDIDGLDPALCPNTGTPVPGGLSFQQACAILNAVVASGRRIVGFDLVEVAPAEGDGQWNANVGARLLYKLIGVTCQTRVVALSPVRGQ